MPNVLAQVILPYTTGIPEDIAVNTWSFDLAAADESNGQQVANFLGSFYNDIISYMSPIIDETQFSVRIYDRADAEPRTPFFSGTDALPNSPGSAPLPEEVAVCLSFQANLVSGATPKRRRGRVYLGPLGATGTIQTGPNSRARVTGGFQADIIAAYENAWPLLTTAGNVHEVWSSVDGVGRTVTRAWVDNEFDTQRRRGVQATGRTITDGPW